MQHTDPSFAETLASLGTARLRRSLAEGAIAARLDDIVTDVMFELVVPAIHALQQSGQGRIRLSPTQTLGLSLSALDRRAVGAAARMFFAVRNPVPGREMTEARRGAQEHLTSMLSPPLQEHVGFILTLLEAWGPLGCPEGGLELRVSPRLTHGDASCVHVGVYTRTRVAPGSRVWRQPPALHQLLSAAAGTAIDAFYLTEDAGGPAVPEWVRALGHSIGTVDWDRGTSGEVRSTLLLGPLRFFNHSCRSNCEWAGWTPEGVCEVRASGSIGAGAELTVDYGGRFEFDSGCACGHCVQDI